MVRKCLYRRGEGTQGLYEDVRSMTGGFVGRKCFYRRGEGTQGLYEDVRSITGGFVGRKCL